MKFRYALYLLLLFILSFSFWTYMRIDEIERRMEREKTNLNRLLRELRIKEERLRELKLKISEEGLGVYTEMSALETLFSYVDRLKKEGLEVNIVKEAVKEGDLWKMDLKLSFKPENSRVMASKLKEILDSKAPIVFLKGLYMDTLEGRVEVLLSLRQPFVRVGR